jgi:hypothetical protein
MAAAVKTADQPSGPKISRIVGFFASIPLFSATSEGGMRGLDESDRGPQYSLPRSVSIRSSLTS